MNVKIVCVDFADGTTEKAVLSEGDTFSLEQGVSICITKKLLSEKSLSGNSLYNKIIQKALKIYDNKQKEAVQNLKKEKDEFLRQEKQKQKEKREDLDKKMLDVNIRLKFKKKLI